MIAGVVLAAGRSSRMGLPKALLELDGRPFLSRILEALAQGGCDPVVVVNGPASQAGSEQIERLATAAHALVATNPDPSSEQIESLRIGVRALPGNVRGVVVTPVDSPRVGAAVVERLVRAGNEGAAVAVPMVAGRRGHPVLFAGEALGELFEELPEGARTLIRRHEADLVEIDVDSTDILLDVDTPEEYERLENRW